MTKEKSILFYYFPSLRLAMALIVMTTLPECLASAEVASNPAVTLPELPKPAVKAAGARLTRLFILSGQSNMNGVIPKESFTPVVTAAFPNDEILVVKQAVSGMPIRAWYQKAKGSQTTKVRVGTEWKEKESGFLYPLLVKEASTATAGKTFDSVTFIWMQGEADAGKETAPDYEENLRGLIQQIRGELKRPDMTVVIGRIHPQMLGSKFWDMVRAAQVQVAEADPLARWLDTDAFERGNTTFTGIYFTKVGFVELGKAFAAKAAGTLKSNEAAGTSPNKP